MIHKEKNLKGVLMEHSQVNKRKLHHYPTLLLLFLFLIGCAFLISCAETDFEEFPKGINSSFLSSHEQQLFIEAIEWWNLLYGGAVLFNDPNGLYTARKEPLTEEGGYPDILGMYTPSTKTIIFNSEVDWWSDGLFCSLSRHELGHVLKLKHHPDPNNFMHHRSPYCPEYSEERWRNQNETT